MSVQLQLLPSEIEVIPGRKLEGRVSRLLIAASNHFETRQTETLRFGFEGIDGDFHAGLTRRSGGREPWYARGTEIRNERQVSLVAPDELATVASRMGIAEVRPEWIGANLVIEDVSSLSMLPSATLMFFESGVTLKIDRQNAPCAIAGRSLAQHAGMQDVQAGALLFAKEARRLRGLVAWVEKPGTIHAGEKVSIRVPEQWIYRP